MQFNIQTSKQACTFILLFSEYQGLKEVKYWIKQYTETEQKKSNLAYQ